MKDNLIKPMGLFKHSGLELDFFKPVGRPIRVLYKGKWRKIIWEPSIIVNGKVLELTNLIFPKRIIKSMKGGRKND